MRRRQFCRFTVVSMMAACFTGVSLHAAGENDTKLPEIRSHVLTVPAKIETSAQDGSERLFISDGNLSFQFFYASHDDGRRLSPFSFVLEPGKTYTFTIEERPYPSFDRIGPEGTKDDKKPEYFWSPVIVSVEDGGNSLYDMARCEVHHCKMERKEIAISYGLMRLQKGLPSLEDEKALFPHRREYVMGGCIIMPGKQTETMYICPQCKDAFTEWQKAHPEPAE